jgi:hypothetical protein
MQLPGSVVSQTGFKTDAVLALPNREGQRDITPARGFQERVATATHESRTTKQDRPKVRFAYKLDDGNPPLYHRYRECKQKD